MLDELELRITEALQCDPRASWRRIARVLGEHERLIARRGTALLESRRVVVAGIRPEGQSTVVRGICHPGARLTTAEALAMRPDSTFTYVLSGAFDVVAEVFRSPRSPSYSLDASITPGLSRAETLPILRYFRTIRGWRLGALTDAEIRALTSGPADVFPDGSCHGPETDVDRVILDALTVDGRMSHEEMARRAGVSESTVRRRFDLLLEDGRVNIRALVEPGAAGLHTEALLWMRVPPHRIEQVATEIAADRRARYVAAVAGACQVVADITVTDPPALYRFLTESPWARHVGALDVSMVAGARKRGGQLLRMPGATEDQPVALS
ncbi:AsnC family transcriptional regulator [Nesterenkonia sp. HG001]|uniref:AsnC family transcriptional regulator n=1 Tax=Nesterenkonia sp. HG001 TaxID=2983207 RepID=UPI002AC6080B|nr:AsnC family transcriptional regulator [Nesterenkonia sp. HG001]MDZ5076514.1 AsnC family transcriptional regulator [Nesterenkonia sp. HG001]